MVIVNNNFTLILHVKQICKYVQVFAYSSSKTKTIQPSQAWNRCTNSQNVTDVDKSREQTLNETIKVMIRKAND